VCRVVLGWWFKSSGHFDWAGNHLASTSCVYHVGVDNLNDMLPIIPHESAGADCCGCIVVSVTGNDAELRCNECGAVVGVVQVGILRDLVSMIPDVHRNKQ
jgi:hypothetical protein